MLHKLSSALLTGVTGFVLTCGFAHAQAQPQSADPSAQRSADPSAQSQQRGTAERSKTTGQNMSVTGCLQEKSKDEYTISGDDGKKYDLKSTSVKLGDHANHKVTVTGKVNKEGQGAEAGELEVSNLKMVSQSCH